MLLGGVGLVFAWLVLGAAPSVFWEDSGNLVASAWVLGLPHPPGEPGWVVSARLAMLIPVGDIAFRANVLSAACVALCAIPLWSLLKACLGGDAPRIGPGVFVVAAGLIGYGARLQAVRAEVYGTTALLLLIALAGAVSMEGRRATAVAAGALGLAATVHPFLAVVALPGTAVARAVCSRVTRADVGLALAFGVLPGAAYALLPVRAGRVPSHSWGVPDDPGSLLDVLLARNFAQNFGGAEADVLANLNVVLEQYLNAGSLSLAVLTIPAILAWRSRRPVRALLAAAPIWIAGNVSTQAFQNKVFAENPDLLGYLLPGFLILVPLAAVGLQAALTGALRVELRRAAMGGATVLAAALLIVQGLDGASADRRDDDLPRRLTSSMGYGLPPGAILMTSGNSTAFVWMYLDVVERRAPDGLRIHRVLLGHEHERLRLDAVVGGDFSVVTGLPWTEGLRSRPLEHLGDLRRPLFVEAREVDLPHIDGLRRHGLVERWGGDVGVDESVAEVAAATLAEMEARPAVLDSTARLLAAQYREIERLFVAERAP